MTTLSLRNSNYPELAPPGKKQDLTPFSDNPDLLHDLRGDFLHIPRGSSGPVSNEADEFAILGIIGSEVSKTASHPL
jgi:hypothetical protein